MGQSNEPCFFGGDLNESYWPKKLLNGAGFNDCFSAQQMPCLPTHPLRPSVAHEEFNADQALDWLFARSPSNVRESSSPTKRQRTNVPVLRPLLATVVRGMCGLSSDDPKEEHKLA